MPLFKLLPVDTLLAPVVNLGDRLPLGTLLLLTGGGGLLPADLTDAKEAHDRSPWAPVIVCMEGGNDNFDPGLLPLILGVDSAAMLGCGDREPAAAELRKAAMKRPGPTEQKLADYGRLRFGKQVGDDVEASLKKFNASVVRRRLHAAGLPAPHLWRAFLETTTALTLARQNNSTQAAVAEALGIEPRSLSRHCRVLFDESWRDRVKGGWWEWEAELFIDHCGPSSS